MGIRGISGIFGTVGGQIPGGISGGIRTATGGDGGDGGVRGV
jgi:hypothetical protein